MTIYTYQHNKSNEKVYIIARNVLMSKLILDKYYTNCHLYTLNT